MKKTKKNKTKQMNILMVASEVAPFSKTGGLADVAGSLPAAMVEENHHLSVVTPYYLCVRDFFKGKDPEIAFKFPVKIGGRTAEAIILTQKINNIDYYFIKNDLFFGRIHLYNSPDGDYSDNVERFAFFSKATIELIDKLPNKIDVVHAHDWQSGFVPFYLRDRKDVKTVFTIHNLGYQGIFPGFVKDMLDVPENEFNPYGVEYYGNVNFLKTGIIYSQAVTTVSKKYSEEILTPEFGFGLEYVLNARKEKLQGIINGVDYDIWDPLNDKEIPSQYTVDDLAGKAACKKALQKAFGLKEDAKAPLIGIVSRLADQKGFDLIAGVIEKFLREGVQFAILGTGQKNLEEFFGSLPAKFPKTAGVKIGFDNKIAHLIEAGSDMFLMPSKYEPCGLNQIYSLRYGTVPIVRGTGGLEDTIIDSTTDAKNGTGYKFYDYSEGALLDAINRTLDGFKSKKEWAKIQKRGMEADYSWSASAKKYLELFESI